VFELFAYEDQEHSNSNSNSNGNGNGNGSGIREQACSHRDAV
jgi:hypothetical protein